VATPTLYLDAMTRRNLEIEGALRPEGESATLLGVFDRTVTPMGSRCSSSGS